MADSKISQMPEASKASGTDLFTIVQSGNNKKITSATFLSNISDPFKSVNDFKINTLNDQAFLFAQSSTSRLGLNTFTPEHTIDVRSGNISTEGSLILRPRVSKTPVSTTGTPISLVDGVTEISSTGATAPLSLPLTDGTSGQIIVIAMVGFTTNVTVSPTNSKGFSTILFNGIGQTATLLFNNGSWVVLSKFNCTIT